MRDPWPVLLRYVSARHMASTVPNAVSAATTAPRGARPLRRALDLASVRRRGAIEGEHSQRAERPSEPSQTSYSSSGDPAAPCARSGSSSSSGVASSWYGARWPIRGLLLVHHDATPQPSEDAPSVRFTAAAVGRTPSPYSWNSGTSSWPPTSSTTTSSRLSIGSCSTRALAARTIRSCTSPVETASVAPATV